MRLRFAQEGIPSQAGGWGHEGRLEGSVEGRPEVSVEAVSVAVVRSNLTRPVASQV
jgi:hypothetical protein